MAKTEEILKEPQIISITPNQKCDGHGFTESLIGCWLLALNQKQESGAFQTPDRALPSLFPVLPPSEIWESRPLYRFSLLRLPSVYNTGGDIKHIVVSEIELLWTTRA